MHATLLYKESTYLLKKKYFMKKDKPWLSHYPAGVDKEVKLDKHTNISEMMHTACEQFGKQIAFENMGRQLSFSELSTYSQYFAAYLQQELGLKKGDRIALQMPNLIQYPVVLFAALQAGLVVVSMNPLYTSEEMKQQLSDAKVSAIVILENFADKLEFALKELPQKPKIVITRIGDLHSSLKRILIGFVLRYVKHMIPKYVLPGCHFFQKAVRKGKKYTFSSVKIERNDLAFLQFTGGTTGLPKAAKLSHSNILSNIAQVKPWFGTKLSEGKETVVTALPLYHIFALTCNCLLLFHMGCRNVLITNPRDIKGFLSILAKTPFSLITGVNTLYNGMLHHTNFKKINFSSLKISVAGGMSLQSVVAEEWEKQTGCPLVEGYGLSETSPVVAINPLDGRHKQGSIGLPVPQHRCTPDGRGRERSTSWRSRRALRKWTASNVRVLGKKRRNQICFYKGLLPNR